MQIVKTYIRKFETNYNNQDYFPENKNNLINLIIEICVDD
jgi:hypothetical protein